MRVPALQGTMAVSTRTMLLSEFIGTYILVLTFGCNVLSLQYDFAGVAIAFTLMVLLYSLGGVSGALFNPAATFALGLCRAMGGPGLDWRTVASYTVVQFLAGLLGAVSYTLLYGKSFNLEPAEGFGWLNAGLCEMLYTFMLCFVTLNVVVARKNLQEKNQYYGLAIGLVPAAGLYGAGAVSGGCFNPALALGIDASSMGAGFGWSAVFVLFELLGAAAACFAFAKVRPEDFRSSAPGSAFVAELLGTWLLVATAGLNVLAESSAAAFSVAAALTSLVYALADVSGAHFNPAVTLAIFVSGRADLTTKQAAQHVLAQMLGAALGCVTYSLVYVGGSFAVGPIGKSTWPQVVIGELLFTFLLAYTVLCVVFASRTKTSHMFGLAIGSCVTAGGFALSGVSGGSLNPALSLATALPWGKGLGAAAVYCIAELLGGLVAVGAFQVTHQVEYGPVLGKFTASS
ncbi:unnamed protein product [Effrenium voratum]|uniref:Aquaporin n=1 Tax=Effrenium voratum TaxID=2562239 RepID=A0AA36IAA5_9DINO|nr:unnamed protein product [Effrenium voratum]